MQKRRKVWHRAPPYAMKPRMLAVTTTRNVEPPADLLRPRPLTSDYDHVSRVVKGARNRRHIEVTIEEARSLLGVDTQRQWPDFALLRTTQALLALVLVGAAACTAATPGASLAGAHGGLVHPTSSNFSDTLALMHRQLWPAHISSIIAAEADPITVPKALLDRLVATLALVACHGFRQA